MTGSRRLLVALTLVVATVAACREERRRPPLPPEQLRQLFRVNLAYSEPGPGRTAQDLREHGVDETLYIAKREVVSLAQVDHVRVSSIEGGPALSFDLTSEGKSSLAAAASRHVGEKMAVFVDGKLFATPVVRGPIPDGDFVISGGTFTEQQLKDLVRRLRAAQGYGPPAS